MRGEAGDHRGRHLQRLDRRAGPGRRLRHALQQRPCLGLRLGRGRAPAEGQARGARRLGLRRAIVPPGQPAHDQRRIPHRPGDDADGIERFAHHLHPRPVQGAVGRLEADRAAIGGRTDDAAGGLGAEAGMEIPRRRPGRRAGGTAARRMRRVGRVGGRPRMPRGEFRRHRLAEDHRPGPPPERDAGGIRPRPVPGPDRRAVLRGLVGGIQHVLHAERQAMQRPRRPPRGARGVELRGLPPGQRRVEPGEGAQHRLPRRDAVQQRLTQRRGGEAAVAQAARSLGGGEIGKMRHGGAPGESGVS